jgi:hypothetical protein
MIRLARIAHQAAALAMSSAPGPRGPAMEEARRHLELLRQDLRTQKTATTEAMNH